MIQVWSLSKSIAGIPYELGAFTHKADAVRMQEGYKNMYGERIEVEERTVYESIYEIDIERL